MLNTKVNEKEEYDYVLKLVLFGHQNAGKVMNINSQTSLALRMAENQFLENNNATIGMEFRKIISLINGLSIKTLLWDLPGQEKFRKIISPIYYKKASGVFILFDLADRNSFEEGQKIYLNIKELLEINTPIIVVGCKSDLNEQRQVEQDAIQEFVDQFKLQYIETSAKTGYNCELALRELQELGLQFRKREIDTVLKKSNNEQGIAQNKCF